MRSSRPFLERSSTFWFPALLVVLLFSVTNLPWTLDDYDQAKQAFTSFRMIHEGHWLYQHTPNEKIATKPPLVGWISAAVYAISRSWETAWRLPSLAAAVLLLVVLTRAATSAYGATAGLVAMSAFGFNLLSPRLATLVRTDIPLALVIFLLGLQSWNKIRRNETWGSRDRLITFALLLSAMLIKGPIVAAFLLPGLVAFYWWKRAAKSDVRAWCGWWPWVAALAIFLLWVMGGIAWQVGFYEQVVLKEFAGRFGETVHRPQPFYFYIPHLLHKFAPWSLLLLGFAIAGWRRKNPDAIPRWRSLPPDMVWLVCWSLSGLVLMSLIPSKRVDRIFPVVPPLCLLVAAQFSPWRRDDPQAARVLRWGTVALIFAALFTTGYAAQRVVSGYRAGDGALVDFGAKVRSEAAANGWRYEVIGGEEEGLLLYLHRSHFLRVGEAVRRWNSDSLDALVAPAEDLPRLLSALQGAKESGLQASVTINDRPRRYVLLTRS